MVGDGVVLTGASVGTPAVGADVVLVDASVGAVQLAQQISLRGVAVPSPLKSD